MVSSCNTCSVAVLGLLQCSYMGKNDVSELKVLWFGIELLDLLLSVYRQWICVDDDRSL